MVKSALSSHILVLTQLAGVGLASYPMDLATRNSPLTLVICYLGVAAAIWTLLHNRVGNFGIYPELKESAVLVLSGPYRMVRHPMYASLILMMIGIAVFNGGWSNLGGVVLVIVAVVLKAFKEEKILCETFPVYREYMAHIRMMVPRLY